MKLVAIPAALEHAEYQRYNLMREEMTAADAEVVAVENALTAAHRISFAIWEGDEDEKKAAYEFRAALAVVRSLTKGDAA